MKAQKKRIISPLCHSFIHFMVKMSFLEEIFFLFIFILFIDLIIIMNSPPTLFFPSDLTKDKHHHSGSSQSCKHPHEDNRDWGYGEWDRDGDQDRGHKAQRSGKHK